MKHPIILGFGACMLSAAAIANVNHANNISNPLSNNTFASHLTTENKKTRGQLPEEDVQIIKQEFLKYDAIININLNIAAALTEKFFHEGSRISQQDCMSYEKRISANYALHSHIYPQGIKLCPSANKYVEFFDGDWVIGESVKYSFSNQPTTNLLDVKGANILSINYDAQYGVKVARQYILDQHFKVTQIIETRTQNIRNNEGKFEPFQFSTMISALDANGNVLSKYARKWTDIDRSYLWQRYIGFVPADPNIPVGGRYYQNNGSGVEVEQRKYLIPYNWKWDKYEVSPFTRMHGLFMVGDKITEWPKQRASYTAYSNPTATCEEGYIGFDENGRYIRLFGNQKCSTDMDVNTTRL